MDAKQLLLASLRNIDLASLAQTWASVSEHKASLKDSSPNSEEAFMMRINRILQKSESLHFPNVDGPTSK